MLNNTLLFQEIHQQPDVLRQLLAHEQATIQQLAQAIQQRGISHVIIAARGTSDNAARYAKYVLGAMNGLAVGLATPSLFSIYKRPISFHNALVLGISQSGQSPDIVGVLAEAKRQGALTAVFTNNIHSPLAQQGDHVINLQAGQERAVAATKTYTSSLAAIALLSATLADDADMHAALQQIPHAATQTLVMNEAIAQVAPRYRYMQRCVTIGRGFNYATAFELALKLKELTYTIVEPYSSADFQHGPLALLEDGFPVIVIAPTGLVTPDIHNFMQTLQTRHAEILCLSDDPATLSLATIPLTIPHSLPEWLSPITAIIPGQLLAMHLAHVRGYNVDKPRGIQKVTETN